MEEGPQSAPLNPLCRNIMLNEIDKELERRGHKFAKYADNYMILCRNKKYSLVHNEHSVSESQSPENNYESYQQGQVLKALILSI